MALYHFEIGFPVVNLSGLQSIGLQYGRHAIGRADAYGLHQLPVCLPNDYQLIELELIEGAIVKLVVRLPYDKTRDIVLALNPNGFVRTLWTNDTTDSHKTLDKSRYTQPATNGHNRKGQNNV